MAKAARASTDLSQLPRHPWRSLFGRPLGFLYSVRGKRGLSPITFVPYYLVPYYLVPYYLVPYYLLPAGLLRGWTGADWTQNQYFPGQLALGEAELRN
jgi:hypothetical protein